MQEPFPSTNSSGKKCNLKSTCTPCPLKTPANQHHLVHMRLLKPWPNLASHTRVWKVIRHLQGIALVRAQLLRHLRCQHPDDDHADESLSMQHCRRRCYWLLLLMPGGGKDKPLIPASELLRCNASLVCTSTTRKRPVCAVG